MYDPTCPFIHDFFLPTKVKLIGWTLWNIDISTWYTLTSALRNSNIAYLQIVIDTKLNDKLMN